MKFVLRTSLMKCKHIPPFVRWEVHYFRSRCRDMGNNQKTGCFILCWETIKDVWWYIKELVVQGVAVLTALSLVNRTEISQTKKNVYFDTLFVETKTLKGQYVFEKLMHKKAPKYNTRVYQKRRETIQCLTEKTRAWNVDINYTNTSFAVPPK